MNRNRQNPSCQSLHKSSTFAVTLIVDNGPKLLSHRVVRKTILSPWKISPNTERADSPSSPRTFFDLIKFPPPNESRESAQFLSTEIPARPVPPSRGYKNCDDPEKTGEIPRLVSPSMERIGTQQCDDKTVYVVAGAYSPPTPGRLRRLKVVVPSVEHGERFTAGKGNSAW